MVEYSKSSIKEAEFSPLSADSAPNTRYISIPTGNSNHLSRTSMAVVLVLSTLLLLFVVHRIIGAWRLLHPIGFLPGHKTVFGFGSIFYIVLPPTRGITLGTNFLFEEKHKIFERLQCDAYASITFWPELALTVYIADVAALKDTFVIKRFPKSVHRFKATDLYGRNIVSIEGDEWKRHRKIATPSFSEKNCRLVWDETLRIVDDLMYNVWDDKDTTVSHAVDITLSLALMVISAAGFGQRIGWGEDTNVKPDNHQLTFRDALHTTASNIILNFVVPDWAKNLHSRLRKIRLSTNELGEYMREMIKDRQASNVENKHDLFSNLIHANNGEMEGTSLNEDELMGNIFMFLLAGHETTAHALAFTFALLALYPEVQEKMLEHIKSVIPDGSTPTYEDMSKLTYVLAVYNESLRMFPVITSVPKTVSEDTSMVVGNNVNEEQRRIPLPKGTQLLVHIPGIHYNPRYWENPHKFMPERFLKDWNRDAFVPFSAGPRICIGRKFNETEGIAALTRIISRYRIEIKDEPQFKHETFEEKKARILKTQLGLTLSPKQLPLVFRRRTK